MLPFLNFAQLVSYVHSKKGLCLCLKLSHSSLTIWLLLMVLSHCFPSYISVAAVYFWTLTTFLKLVFIWVFCMSTLQVLSVLQSRLCNDWAIAHIEQVCAGTGNTLWSHIWQEIPAHSSSQRGSRYEASSEAIHQEETTTILDRQRRPAETDSQWWKR